MGLAATPQTRCSSNAFVGITHSEPSGDKLGSLGYEIANGTIVTNVVACSAAERAGLQPLDYLYAVDGQRVERDGFFCLLADRGPGDSVEIELLRRGEPLRVRLELGEKDFDCDRDAPFRSRGFFGISGVRSDSKPGTILDVSSDGPVAELGLRDGDRLLRVDGYPIGDWNDLSSVKRVLGDLDNVTFELVRDGTDLVIAGPIEAKKEYGDSDGWNWSWTDSGSSYRLSDAERQEIRDDVREAVREARAGVREARESVREALTEVRSELRDAGRDAEYDLEEDRELATDILQLVGASLDEAWRGLSDDYDDLEEGDAERADVSMGTTLGEVSATERERLSDEGVDLPATDGANVEKLVVGTDPDNEKVDLSFYLPERGETTVRIYNDAGREVYTYGLGEFTGAFEDQLDIKRNGRGDYFLVITQGDEASVSKIALD